MVVCWRSGKFIFVLLYVDKSIPGADACIKSGRVSVFDLGPESTAAEIDQRIIGTEPNISYPAFQFDAHLDAVGSVAFNPYYPLLLSTSGSRHFLDPEMGESEDDEEQDDTVPKLKRNGPVTMDNSVRVWRVS